MNEEEDCDYCKERKRIGSGQVNNDLLAKQCHCGLHFGAHASKHPHKIPQRCLAFNGVSECIYPRLPTAEEIYEILRTAE